MSAATIKRLEALAKKLGANIDDLSEYVILQYVAPDGTIVEEVKVPTYKAKAP